MIEGMPADNPCDRPCSPPEVPGYQPLRVIGEGSYGQVWLARSATGVLRAIKIVRREESTGGRDFARAFNGLRHYEPISRLDASLLDVLHVGPVNPTDHFYCVMELADAAPSLPDPPPTEPGASRFDDYLSPAGEAVWNPAEPVPIDPETYVPLTLRWLREQYGRLSVAACVEIGAALCQALEALHRHGLVHRDVKPSNIIFAQGRPKLADIDLVALPEDTLPHVFAPGFSPPEGAGSASGDLYSLGKVLYEMSSGQDRTAFPVPPTRLPPDEATRWADLNEVLIRACATLASDRYASAKEMREDLEVVRSGKSVRRLRTLERRHRIATRVGLASLALAVLLAGAYLRENSHLHKYQALAAQNREHAVRLHLSRGFHLLDEGDYSGALPSLVAAWGLEGDDPGKSAVHCLRVRTILQQGPRLLALGAHAGPITSSEFSHDGKFVVTSSHDRTARVWDAATGLPVTAPLAHPEVVILARFSPDDLRVSSVSSDGAVRTWDSRSGKPLRSYELPVKGAEVAAISPDGRWVAAGGSDGVAAWVNLDEGRILRDASHRDAVTAIQWSPDSQRLATGGIDGYVRVLVAKTGTHSIGPFQHQNTVRSLAFSPDARWLASGSADTTAQVWDTQTGERVGPPLPHESTVWTLAFSADGQMLASGGGRFRRSGEAKFWRLPAGESVGHSLRHRMPINRVSLSKDGKWIATSGVDNCARVWDSTTHDPVGPILRHNHAVRTVQFSPDGTRLLSASRDGTWRVWRLTPEFELGPKQVHTQSVAGLCITSDGRWIASGSEGGDGWIADAETLQLVVKLAPDGEARTPRMSKDGRWLIFSRKGSSEVLRRDDGTGGFRSTGVWDGMAVLAVSPDGSTVLAWLANERFGVVHPKATLEAPRDGEGTGDAAKESWDTSSRFLLPAEPNNWTWSHEFSPDGRWLAVGFGPPDTDPLGVRRGYTRVYRSDNGSVKFPPLLQDGRAPQLSFSPDSLRLVTACSDSTPEGRRAHLWDLESGKEIGPGMPHSDGVVCVRFSHDGRRIVTGSEDGEAQVWDAETQQPLGHRMRHPRGVLWVEFSQDGHLIATGCSDGTARLWDGLSGDPVSAPIPGSGGITQARFTPDGRSLVTGSFDGDLRLRKLPLELGDRRHFEALSTVYSGVRVSDDGEAQTTPASEQARIFQELRASSGL